ncbi:hypothetical protein DSO57_1016552 [Entomophthora muscae]|uniref:Uncharacterized protein n=1 Tax=Entomophthora muscae TaxID=34485 RepID=A0ACC2RJJ1_9FUNG|nr:hypothetical protein DSO57_1016552 [Entomophthora muscae]
MEEQYKVFHSDNNPERASSRNSRLNGLTPRPLSRLSILNPDAPPTKRPNCPRISLLSGALNGSLGPKIYRADLDDKWKLEEDNEEVRKQTIDYSSKFREILEGVSKDFSEKSEKGLATLKFLINDTSELKTHIQKYEVTINNSRPSNI